MTDLADEDEPPPAPTPAQDRLCSNCQNRSARRFPAACRTPDPGHPGGGGDSRSGHAVWALLDLDATAVVAPGVAGVRHP
ncbi:hypothetical protein [Microtetraspora malaysiensis]|uniref:hypothetical protein n=1 Tax=Microtetraspora malaysiensis TaxID=161358 RepID=UPI003D8D4DF5